MTAQPIRLPRLARLIRPTRLTLRALKEILETTGWDKVFLEAAGNAAGNKWVTSVEGLLWG